MVLVHKGDEVLLVDVLAVANPVPAAGASLAAVQ